MNYEIGDDELIGDDDDVDALLGLDEYDIGAARRGRTALARRGGGGNMRAALAQRMANSGTILRESAPTKSRQYVLGFDSVATIAAAGVLAITSNPQVVFRPERLVVSGAIAGSFLITDFRVGKNSQFASAGSVPADAFAPNAFGVRLKCDTAQISSQVVISVTNISLGALRFTAAVFGDAVE